MNYKKYSQVFFHITSPIFLLAVNLVLPSRCPLTGQIVDQVGALSVDAWRELTFISAPFCDCCGFPFEVVDTPDVSDHSESCLRSLCGPCLASPKPYVTARSVFAYDDASRDLVLAFKHGDQTRLTTTFTPLLMRCGSEILARADLIVPVPLHWLRLVKRRYNQAALLGRAVSKASGVVFDPRILKRIRSTPSQGYKSHKERFENVRAAFSVGERDNMRIVGKKIVLIDDVYTTGATLEECCRVLLDAGASQVDILTLARVVKPH
ncbi:MAG TPA: ComF family protein [Alphaproteobacteria bacterium]|nr:ComF family protein [Alphaproteobacteria bacterium]